MTRTFPLLFILFITGNLIAQTDPTSYSEKLLVMGMTFEVKAVSSSYDSSYHAVKLAIVEAHRIDTLLSSHIPGTYTNQINQFAGIKPVKSLMKWPNWLTAAKKSAQLPMWLSIYLSRPSGICGNLTVKCERCPTRIL
jgi:hypothetical protein